ncbi:TonB-dependent receptor [Pseudopedobacter beijingensis]|uniref:TonB-dependent receptor n=1 Tax=Pseudopedobacter beijingensis TaxID=1207056 RepID=A0ABW4I8T2_9SPHI
MQIRKFLLIGALLLTNLFYSFAQNSKSSINGKITDENGEPIPGALVKILNTSLSTTSDLNGNFNLKNIPSGKQTVQASSVGMTTASKEVSLKPAENYPLNFKMITNVQQMETVSVIGRSAVQDVNRQAYNVIAIDAKKLHNTTLDISHALDRVSGIRVRESGGVGSRIDFAMNGFNGRQVKFFIDGVPMENFGSSFQINNIPINLAERVEVYKGVVPIWLGSDALGGAVNIVTDSSPRTYADAAYSFGSFNTHRSSVNAGIITKKGITFQVNAFQNYSDNNYWVTVETSDLYTGKYYPEVRVRRFHDNYHNETVIANIGVVNKKYADKLTFGITAGQNKADIQTGARMKVVYGSWFREGNTIIPQMKYQKNDLFLKNLNFNMSANYNLGHEQNIDTVNIKYNWLGETKPGPVGVAGGEQTRQLYKFRNNNGLATANLSYKIADSHAIMLNNVTNFFNRKGWDALSPESEANEQPRISSKNITGLGYRFQPNEKWNTTVFGKYFYQRNKYSQSYTISESWGAQTYYLEQVNKYNKLGYGIAATYFLLPNLQIKASHEKAYRLPETEELFGDLLNISGNISLKPEQSYNYNAGVTWATHINKIHRFNFDVNALYRKTSDFIRVNLDPNQVKQSMKNWDNVENKGIDGEIRYSYKNLITSGINVTYQDIKDKSIYQQNSNVPSLSYNTPMPNLPTFFSNVDLSVFLHNVYRKGNTLSFGYNLLYVAPFYLYTPAYGTTSTKFLTERQYAHDASIVYTMANGKYNIAFECKNLMDNLLIDNYSLQKPSRGFYVKTRYYFSRKSN